MPFTRHPHPDLNFILTRVWGQLTDDDITGHVRALNEDHGDGEALLELGDARGMKPGDLRQVTFAAMFGAARMEDGQSRTRGGKLAIVADDPLIFGFARAYTALSSQFRADAGAFREIEPALEWLGLSDHTVVILEFMHESRCRDEDAGGS